MRRPWMRFRLSVDSRIAESSMYVIGCSADSRRCGKLDLAATAATPAGRLRYRWAGLRRDLSLSPRGLEL